MGTEAQTDVALLDEVQRETFAYFLHEANDANGLVADCTRPGWPSSIAATGLGLASYPVGVERGWMSREKALDSGRRTWESEVSTVDSAFPIAGALLAAQYFDRADADERRVRELADALYRRMDWQWAQNGAGRSRTAGNRRADSSRIAGSATARRCSSTRSAWARRRTRCRPPRTTRGSRPMTGATSTASRRSTRAVAADARLSPGRRRPSARGVRRRVARGERRRGRAHLIILRACVVMRPM
jgi:hypothetical protein